MGDYDLQFDLADVPGLGDALTGELFALELTSDGQVHVDADVDFDLNFTFEESYHHEARPHSRRLAATTR